MKLHLLICIVCTLSIVGCRKLVETDPPSDKLTGATVFESDGTAIAVLSYIYGQMNQAPFQGAQGISVFTGMGSDELIARVASGFNSRYYRNDLNLLAGTGAGAAGGEQWLFLYNLIYRCNEAIEGLSKSTKLTSAIQKQLLGEAKFLRAYYYFYLVNFFGDVPLILGIDAEVNTMQARSSTKKVYEQIISDLKEAEELLAVDFLDITLLSATTERVRPTKWAASALLARVYLYTKQWDKAEERASAVLANTNLFGPLPAINSVFTKNSREAIWQLQPTRNNQNTEDGNAYIIPSTGPNNNKVVVLSQILRNNFEANDSRAMLGNWINKVVYNVSGAKDSVYFPFKYKKDAIASAGVSTAGAMTEYFMVLRLGEQYLIRAEARAQLNNLSGAIDDLDKIRGRASLPLIATTNPGISQTSLLDKILHERQVELFCEGHRWLDLKRTGKIDDVMSIITPLKSAGTVQWRPYQALYPIPYLEIQRGPNLVQNPGY